jgi:small subunit ribosomal protein S18
MTADIWIISIKILYKFRPHNQMARKLQVNKKISKRHAKTKVRGKKKDPIFVEGARPRPMYVDYKDVELLKKLTNRQGKIISRRKSGCIAVSQHAVTKAIKRARFMALIPYVGE